MSKWLYLFSDDYGQCWFYCTQPSHWISKRIFPMRTSWQKGEDYGGSQTSLLVTWHIHGRVTWPHHSTPSTSPNSTGWTSLYPRKLVLMCGVQCALSSYAFLQLSAFPWLNNHESRIVRSRHHCIVPLNKYVVRLWWWCGVFVVDDDAG